MLIDEAQLAGQMGGNSGKNFSACYLLKIYDNFFPFGNVKKKPEMTQSVAHLDVSKLSGD